MELHREFLEMRESQEFDPENFDSYSDGISELVATVEF